MTAKIGVFTQTANTFSATPPPPRKFSIHTLLIDAVMTRQQQTRERIYKK
jgi:hypothetical protein